MRVSYANIVLAPGSKKPQQFHVPSVETWQTEQSVDNDVDSFSIDVGDVAGQLLGAIDRDTEVRVAIFCGDDGGRVHQVFSGLVDVETFATQKTHTMQGGDVPSSILLGTDAEPGYWRHKDPRDLLVKRGRALGLTRLKIAPMRQIGRLWSDASEKEWAFWYRVARTSGHYMWSTSLGELVIDNLNYSIASFSYSFGDPPARQQRAGWIPVDDVSIVSNKQQRIARATVYGEDKKKKGFVPYATAANTAASSIDGWLRRPVAISTLTTARTQKDLDDEASLQVFESIVGAQEYQLTIGARVMVEQNTMARVNLPGYGLVGTYYVVGVSRSLSAQGGLVQVVRLREPGFAIDKRVPSTPSLTSQPNAAVNTSTANIAEGLARQGVRWYGAFVRAAREFGVANSWDMSVFLGVLLSICSVESGFRNVREGGDAEWFAMPTSIDPDLSPKDPFTGAPIFNAPTLQKAQQMWREEFANSASNPLNPFRNRGGNGEAGVGPMQLTSVEFKQWADGFGWSGGSASGTPEYAGGRWNPESNIRAAAKALIGKLKAVGADPTNSGTIWAGVAAYNGAGAAANNYAAKVREAYKQYGPEAASAVQSAAKTVPGSAQKQFRDGDGNVVVSLPDDVPATVAKAITWAMSRRGDRYQWAGVGPLFDCSSFVDHAIAFGDPSLANQVGLSSAQAQQHGYDTFQLFDRGLSVAKSNLLPGDLVFFVGSDGTRTAPGHVGMYVGDGQFIQDPQTGDVVKISALNEQYWRESYVGARRFFSWPGGPH